MYTAPVLQTKLHGSLWGIAAYFNPVGYRSRKKNYDLFRMRLKMQGVPFIVAEAALGDAPFELANDDADIVLRFRTDSVLWQKERLLNLARAALPEDCDKVVCLDTDICFLDADWKENLSHALEQYVVVQPYERIAQGKKDYVPPEDQTSIDTMDGEKGISSACASIEIANQELTVITGHPGYATAMRRTLLDNCGFYEKMILGGGDSLFLGACFGMDLKKNTYLSSQKGLLQEDSFAWCKQIHATVQGSISWIKGDIVHLWHGDRNERFYVERETLLETFHPQTDIHAVENGCLEWGEAEMIFRKTVEAYFHVRNEDDEGACTNEAAILRAKLIAAREKITAVQ